MGEFLIVFFYEYVLNRRAKYFAKVYSKKKYIHNKFMKLKKIKLVIYYLWLFPLIVKNSTGKTFNLRSKNLEIAIKKAKMSEYEIILFDNHQL